MSLEQRGVFYFDDTGDYPAELLKAFQHSSWSETSKEFRSSLNELQTRKFKQLSLISMAIDTKSLRYGHVSQQLDIPSKEVELFLVESLLDKAVEGKVNAADETLYIYSCATRNCSPQQVEEATKLLDSFMSRLEGTIHANMARLKAEAQQGLVKKRSLGDE